MPSYPQVEQHTHKAACSELTEGTRRALAALRRDLPELLVSHRGQFVCYHLEQRLGIDKDDMPLLRECDRRGIPLDEWIVQRIEPRGRGRGNRNLVAHGSLS